MPKPKKREVILSLPKNIGAMHISNDLTLVERKIMNIILWNAFNIEKSNLLNNKSFNKDNKKFYCIDIAEIEDALGWGTSSDRNEIRKALKKLVSTSLEFNILKKQNTDGGKWNITSSLLSDIITDNDNNANEIYYAFSEGVKDIIIEPTLYGWLNLEEQKNIDSKYSIALLEYLEGAVAITKRTETKTQYIAIDDYKKLVAGDKCNYTNFKDVNRFLIKSPLKELNDKTTLQAKASFQKSGRKVVGISFDVKKDKNNPEQTTLELNFDTTPNEQRDTLNDVYRETYKKPSKEEENTPKTTLNANEDIRKINELMIKHNISEKKRKSFLEYFSSKHIEENIKYLTSQKQWKNKPKEVPVGLLIKAIEDNYANHGAEKEEITTKQKYLLELREVFNPIVEKTGRRFLRNLLQDYQIYKDRRDKPAIECQKTLLQEAFQRIDFLNIELIKIGFKNEEEILNALGIKSDEDFKRIIFYSKEELNDVRNEVENG